MTFAELEEILTRNGVSVTYLGYGSSRRKSTPSYACTIGPSAYSTHWARDEFAIRGSGDSLVEAVNDALYKLSVFLISKTKSPYED